MSRFSIRNPHFIVVVCLVLLVIGATSFARMPVDLFPTINLPEVVVATFYSGMPPEDIETDITDPLERFFTLASRALVKTPMALPMAGHIILMEGSVMKFRVTVRIGKGLTMTRL